MSNTIKIEIEVASREQSEIFLAELSEIGFEAFEETKNSLCSFIKEDSFNEDQLHQILPKNISYKKTIIEETNWNAKWESEFEPIIIDHFVGIRASFHPPIKNVKHEIIITPKMSFGTGHHATTYLMLQQMESMDFLNKRVLDFGTGTGILAILAEKLGAKNIVATDIDEWSINNAKENFHANNCNEITLLQKADLENIGDFDIILANINLNVITANIKALNNISALSSQILISGFLKIDESIIQHQFNAAGYTLNKLTEKNNWISMLLTNS